MSRTMDSLLSMAPPPASHMLLFLVLSTLVFSHISPACSGAPDGIRVDMTHVDSAGNFTKLEILQRALKRGEHRMTSLIAKAGLAADSADEVQTPTHAGTGEFLMDLAIGTPSVPFSAILDTGSDLIWTQCKPCVKCYKQPTPIFDPSASSTFSKLPCSSTLCRALPSSTCDTGCQYLYSYGDYSSTQGILATETFAFGSSGKVSVPHIGFGCGESNQGSGFKQGSGLVGLGRGPLSLNSQLGMDKFSYCLTKLDESSKKSPLLFGSLAKLSGGKGQSTPLVKNPSQPTFYYLSLKGITVGATLLSIPTSTFALNEDGTGGLIIDSGTSITYLEVQGYRPLKKAFLSQVKLPVADGSVIGLDLCFSLQSDSSAENVEVPKLTFHFEGADLDLPPENYMIIDASSGLLCLTIMGSSGMSILGNFQQQNIQILYDLQNEKLSFVPAQCDKL